MEDDNCRVAIVAWAVAIASIVSVVMTGTLIQSIECTDPTRIDYGRPRAMFVDFGAPTSFELTEAVDCQSRGTTAPSNAADDPDPQIGPRTCQRPSAVRGSANCPAGRKGAHRPVNESPLRFSRMRP